ncbi:MAG: hypothetical protein JO198_06625 [Candidatus Dormibacteraeota bacterium]|nr:hypothetical protein [Candidatus Dormibacteraeota bacterium]
MMPRYYALQDLFLGYFHPDWREESRTRSDAVKKFLRTARPEAVAQVVVEIQDLLSTPLTDEQLRAVLTKDYSLFYDPWKDEITAREWLTGLARDLEEPVEG